MAVIAETHHKVIPYASRLMEVYQRHVSGGPLEMLEYPRVEQACLL